MARDDPSAMKLSAAQVRIVSIAVLLVVFVFIIVMLGNTGGANPR